MYPFKGPKPKVQQLDGQLRVKGIDSVKEGMGEETGERHLEWMQGVKRGNRGTCMQMRSQLPWQKVGPVYLMLRRKMLSAQGVFKQKLLYLTEKARKEMTVWERGLSVICGYLQNFFRFLRVANVDTF